MSKVFDMIRKEEERQAKNIELIASENFVSENILKAVGSCLTNKYAEGYPYERHSGNKGRYYGGTQFVDEIEEYCCDLFRKLFDTGYHVNVQPHSGSQANFAAYFSVLEPGDTILAMSLNNGGHLTHGAPVSFSGKLFNVVFYNTDEHGYIDYNDIAEKIRQHKPKLVLAGASAYPRIIDFERIKKIIDTESNALEIPTPYFMVDMAHIAGLVAAGEHPSPFGWADIVTTTTHKTLRGPRGGLIFCRQELAKKVDSAIFPFSQGGGLQHVVAAKAICAEEACTEEFRDYIRRVVINSRVMADEFVKMGYNVVTGGTDNHLFLLDFSDRNFTGKLLQDALDKVNITLNKNCVPNEKRSPQQTSGVRIGTAAMTTKGYTTEDFIKVAHRIDEVIKALENRGV